MISRIIACTTPYLANAVFSAGLIFLVSVLTLVAALAGEYLFGLQPCALCIYQRWPYVLTALISATALFVLYRAEFAKIAAIMVALCGIVFLVGAGIAAYHVGVQERWWASGVDGCAVSFNGRSIDDLMALIDSAPAARCDEVSWRDPVLGLSMAAHNVIMSLAMAAFSLLSALLIARKANGVL